MTEKYIEKEKENIINRLFEVLRIPSVSTDESYRKDCLNQANWFFEILKEWGYEVDLWGGDNEGLPAVFAQGEQVKGRRTVLFYGHYDVQPADPIELWDSDPFDPVIKDGSIYARGANDDKGQLFTFLEALNSFCLDDDGLDLNIKILLEGEEESGSPSLPSILRQHETDLSCDVVLVSDMDMWSPQQPAFTTMLKGKCSFEVTLFGADRDLHSGMYGGFVSNPANILTRVIGKMFDDDNYVLVPGFYDGVQDLDDHLKARWAPLNTHILTLMKDVGMSHQSGEKGYSALESNWSRPTLEINGLTAGYQGRGGKTVIPSKASAKISCRLVEGQDPDKIFQSFIRFFEEYTPADINVYLENQGCARSFIVDYNNPYLKKAQYALDKVFDHKCLIVGCGASIPVAIDLYEVTKAPILLGGWGQPKDAIHAPNENYSLDRFFNGIKGWAAVLKSFEEK